MARDAEVISFSVDESENLGERLASVVDSEDNEYSFKSEIIRDAIVRKLDSEDVVGNLDSWIESIKSQARELSEHKYKSSNHDGYRYPSYYESKINEVEDKLETVKDKISAKESELEDLQDSLENSSIDDIKDETGQLNDEINQLDGEKQRLAGIQKHFRDKLRESQETEKERQHYEKKLQRQLTREQLLPALSADLDSHLKKLTDRLEKVNRLEHKLNLNRETKIRHYVLTNLRKSFKRIDTAQISKEEYSQKSLPEVLEVVNSG